jgi:hypothetical protein
VLQHPFVRTAAGTLAASTAVAVVWWLATPAGLVGSLAGSFILAGVILLLVGLFLSAGADRVADNMLPGANVGRMAEQGLTGERRFLAPRRRGAGVLTMLGGVVYLAAGALLWSWR